MSGLRKARRPRQRRWEPETPMRAGGDKVIPRRGTLGWIDAYWIQLMKLDLEWAQMMRYRPDSARINPLRLHELDDAQEVIDGLRARIESGSDEGGFAKAAYDERRRQWVRPEREGHGRTVRASEAACREIQRRLTAGERPVGLTALWGVNPAALEPRHHLAQVPVAYFTADGPACFWEPPPAKPVFNPGLRYIAAR